MPKPDLRRFILQEIDEKQTAKFTAAVEEWEFEDPTIPVRVIVSSYGGLVDEMFAIYDFMKTCHVPLITVGLGKIMSASVLILAAGTKGMRCMTRNSVVMVHGITNGIYGTLYHIENEVKALRRSQNKLIRELSRETGCSVKTLREVFDLHRDEYMTPQQAKQYGIIDRVIANDRVKLPDEPKPRKKK